MGKRASSRGAKSPRTVKQRVLAALEKLPADATFEDAFKRLVFLAKIDRGLAEMEDVHAIRGCVLVRRDGTLTPIAFPTPLASRSRA
jgi:hypothetical protein